ncbi:hypothetical protein T01_2960 [Trichinella spiralis]|uniref:Uncharacterized protein n=1 Tax=Trichinella spiralis TaxID=6334 RepID=A0A0V1AQ10_TRISP|nr:hypothetical protein T01_2960 [Trichinella spiralis]
MIDEKDYIETYRVNEHLLYNTDKKVVLEMQSTKVNHHGHLRQRSRSLCRVIYGFQDCMITRYHFKNTSSCFGTLLIISILFYELVHDLCTISDNVLEEFCC